MVWSFTMEPAIDRTSPVLNLLPAEAVGSIDAAEADDADFSASILTDEVLSTTWAYSLST